MNSEKRFNRIVDNLEKNGYLFILMESFNLPHESNQYTQRIDCVSCKRKNVFTRVLAKNDDLFSARYLCHNCATDYVDKNEGWHVVTTKVSFVSSTPKF